jgi:hypothetical protein
VYLQLGHVRERLAGLTGGEHDPDPLSQQTPGDEGQRQRRGLIQPLRVIDDTEQRTLLSHLGEQGQHPQPDKKPIRRGAGAQPKHDFKGLSLWRGKPRSPIEQRCAQLLQAGVRQLHLRLNPHRPNDGQLRRRLDQVLQQRRLPDPSLPSQNQRSTLSAADRR